MFAVRLTAQWVAWVAALAAVLHCRSAWRLAHVIVSILLAHGRRTVASWWRAAGIGGHFRSYVTVQSPVRHQLCKNDSIRHNFSNSSSGGADRLPGSAPPLPARLRGASTGGVVDREGCDR